MLGQGQDAETDQRRRTRQEHGLANQAHEGMPFVEISLIGADVVDAVIDPHPHDDDPEHDPGNVDRAAQQVQRPDGADEGEEHRRQGDQGQAPRQEEEKQEAHDRRPDDHGDLREERNKDFAETPVEKPRIEEAGQARRAVAREEGLGVVGRPRRHHGDMNEGALSRRDADDAGEFNRDRDRGRRRSSQRGREVREGVGRKAQLAPRPFHLALQVRDPRGRPEGPPVRRAAPRQLFPREEVGEGEGGSDHAPPGVLPQHPRQPVAPRLELPGIPAFGHDVDPAGQIPPDPLDGLLRRDRIAAYGVHGVDIDVKYGTREEEHEPEEEGRRRELDLPPRKDDRIQDPAQPAVMGLPGRRHDGENPRKDPVNEQIGETHPQGGEDADLRQDAEAAQEEHEKCADRRQGGEPLRRPHLAGGLFS